jgi:NhaA family Na+:H+ antiporter
MLSQSRSPSSRLRQFLALEAAGGIVLGAAAGVALILANSPLLPFYRDFLDIPLAVQAGGLLLKKPLLLWINDGLMAVFFLLVGLEVKREILAGGLADRSKAVLPAIAALGGMAVPAAVYVAFTWGDPQSLRGWAIPTATDIAFALGVLSLAGSRVAPSLRLFLLAVAIIDDLGAIVIIALFYTAELSRTALALAGIGLAALAALNLAGVARRAPYLLTGAFLWVCVLKSGVHATLAGVAVGIAVPLSTPRGASPLLRLEHDLQPWVAYGVLPAFAFANAGVGLAGMTLATLLHPVELGIAFGLIIGKPVGVAGAIWAATRAGFATLPENAEWRQVCGLALLTGIGFTMSLFIGGLAFPAEGYDVDIRIGVLLASLVAGTAGYLLLRTAPRAVQPKSTVTTS